MAVGLVLADQLELGLRRGLGQEVVHTRFGGDRRGRESVVTRDHDRLDAHLAQLGEALPDAALDDVAQFDDAEHARTIRNCERRGALARNVVNRARDRRRPGRTDRLDELANRVGRAFAQPAALEIDAAHARLCRELVERVRETSEIAASQLEFMLRQHDDRASFGCLVGQRGQLRGVGEVLLRHAWRRMERRRLPVAQRDRAGLVEQQYVHVPGRLDRAATGRNHIRAHHAVHAGDADRGQEPADRRRNQAHEEGDEHDDRHGRPGTGRRHRECGEWRQRRRRKQEHQRQHREQDRQRDLVRRPAPLCAFDESDHPVDERVTGVARHPHDEPIGEHPRAAGHGAEVATGLAQYGRGLARDRALVNGRHAVDRLAVRGDRILGLDQHQVVDAQRLGAHPFIAARAVWRTQPLRDDLAPRRAQGSRLGLAASLGDGFGEIGEQHGEPQPRGDRENEAWVAGVVADSRRRSDTDGRGEDAADVDDEHDRIADLHARIEFPEGIPDACDDDRTGYERLGGAGGG